MKENSIILELQMPPSLNCLFAGLKRRHKSNAYEDWLTKVDIEFNKKYGDYNYKITGFEWLEVHLNYFFSLYTKKGDKRIKDTANYEKATIDYLCTKIKGLKDEHIKVLHQEKHDSDLAIVKIVIKEL